MGEFIVSNEAIDILFPDIVKIQEQLRELSRSIRKLDSDICIIMSRLSALEMQEKLRGEREKLLSGELSTLNRERLL